MEGYPCPFSRRRNLAIAVSKMVTTVVRHYDQDERHSDGAINWDTTRSVLSKAFAKHGARQFSEKYWLYLVHEGSKQGKKWVLWGFHKILSLLSSNSPWVDGICSNSLPLETVCLSQRLFFQPSIYPGEWIDSGWTWGRQRTTDWLSSSHHLTLLGEIPMKKNLVMITPFLKKRTTVIGSDIKMPLQGKIVPSTRTRIAILAHEDTRNHCTQSCASRLHQQSYFSRRRSNCSKDSRLHDQRQKSHSKAIGNRSRRAQGNLHTTGRWWVMSEATQQMIKLAQGDFE